MEKPRHHRGGDLVIEPIAPESVETYSPVAAAVAPGPARAVAVLAEIDRWFVETFHQRGIEVSEFSHYRAQVDALKARLVAALSDKER